MRDEHHEGDDAQDERSLPLLPPVPAFDPPVDGSMGPTFAPPSQDAQRLQDSPLQDAQGLQEAPSPDAQRLQDSPSQDAQRLQDSPSQDAQRLQDSQRVDAQRSEPSQTVDAQRASPPDAAQVDPRPRIRPRSGDAQRGRSLDRLRSLHRARPRLSIGLGAGVLAAASTVLIVNAQRDDEPPRVVETSVVIPATDAVPPTRPAPIESTAPTADSAAPAAAAVTIEAAPATTEAATTSAPETTIAATTTIEPTTTVPVPSSFAGTYSVTASDLVLVSETLSTVLAQQPAQEWFLTGTCDGFGDCTLSGNTVGFDGGDTLETIVLVPSGSGTYIGEQDVTDIGFDCGDVSAIFEMSVGPGGMSGTYRGSATGAADCPAFTLTANYAGILVGP